MRRTGLSAIFLLAFVAVGAPIHLPSSDHYQAIMQDTLPAILNSSWVHVNFSNAVDHSAPQSAIFLLSESGDIQQWQTEPDLSLLTIVSSISRALMASSTLCHIHGCYDPIEDDDFALQINQNDHVAHIRAGPYEIAFSSPQVASAAASKIRSNLRPPSHRPAHARLKSPDQPIQTCFFLHGMGVDAGLHLDVKTYLSGEVPDDPLLKFYWGKAILTAARAGACQVAHFGIIDTVRRGY
jgi:hypothetical protein